MTNGRLDDFALLTRTFGAWERILGVSWTVDPGVLTGDGSRCWSRSLASSGNQGHPERNRLWLCYATTKNDLYDKKAGAGSQTLNPGPNCSLEPGSPIELCLQAIDVDQALSSTDVGRYVLRQNLVSVTHELNGSQIK